MKALALHLDLNQFASPRCFLLISLFDFGSGYRLCLLWREACAALVAALLVNHQAWQKAA